MSIPVLRNRPTSSLPFLLMTVLMTLVFALACAGPANPADTATEAATAGATPAAIDTSTPVTTPTAPPSPAATLGPSPSPASVLIATLVPASTPAPIPAATTPAPAPTLGPAQVTVIDTAAVVDFPNSITFSLEALSGLPIEKIALEFGTERAHRCSRTYSTVNQEFARGHQVKTSWPWEFKKGGAPPPGVAVWWRWRIMDEAGRKHLTSRRELPYEDLRFEWRSITKNNIEFFWYEGGVDFGNDVAALVDQEVSRLQLGNQAEKPIKVFIYATAEDVRGAFLFANVWTGGRAYLSYNNVLIAISPDRLATEGPGLTHELAHLLVNEATFNCFAGLDPWLSEGLAVYSEGPVSKYFQNALARGIAGEQLISVRSLSSSFPAAHSGAILSYAQSQSLVEFLIDTYGWEKMRQLLSIFKDGSTTDKALRTVYGFDRDGLNQRWKQHIGAN